LFLHETIDVDTKEIDELCQNPDKIKLCSK